MISNFIELVQHHKLLYILIVGIIIGVINTILYFVQKKADENADTSSTIKDNKNNNIARPLNDSAKRKHIIATLLICIIAAIIPLIISIYFPPLNDQESDVIDSIHDNTTSISSLTTNEPVATPNKPVVTPNKPVVTTNKPVVTTNKPVVTTNKPIVTTNKPVVTTNKPVMTTNKPVMTTNKPVMTTNKPVMTTDKPVVTTKPVENTLNTTQINTENKHSGNLKLSFFNGRFSYRTPGGGSIYNENDVVTESERSYFSDSIAPLVYITIIDDKNSVVFDGKSEHLNSCLIQIDYGTYTLIASCDNYKKYTTTITLTPDNKKVNVWQHDIYFIPDEYVASDLKIQVIDKDGALLTNCEVSIGYTGFALIETVDETGIINELFTLSKGEYLVYIESLDLYGSFYVNESTDSDSLIVVKLE